MADFSMTHAFQGYDHNEYNSRSMKLINIISKYFRFIFCWIVNIMSSRQPKSPKDKIAHTGDCDRGINWRTELEDLTELFTLLSSHDMSDYYVDRRLSQIRDQHHLHYDWRMYRTRINFFWFQLIIYLKIFKTFPQLCSQVKSVTVTILSLAVYYLSVVFYWLDLMEI